MSRKKRNANSRHRRQTFDLYRHAEIVGMPELKADAFIERRSGFAGSGCNRADTRARRARPPPKRQSKIETRRQFAAVQSAEIRGRGIW